MYIKDGLFNKAVPRKIGKHGQRLQIIENTVCKFVLVFQMFPLEFSKHCTQRRLGLLKLKLKEEEEKIIGLSFVMQVQT